MKVLELFAGIGAIRTAMGEEHSYTPIEFDKRVINVYNKLYNTQHPTTDITTYQPNEEFDMVVGGFPCQPFSKGGKGLGFEDEKGKLYKDTLRIVEETKPDYVILENVKGILQDKHIWIIDEIKEKLLNLNYNVEVKIISGNDIGWIQNRVRVFIIASKFDIKEIVNAPLTKKIKDYLEPLENARLIDISNKEIKKSKHFLNYASESGKMGSGLCRAYDVEHNKAPTMATLNSREKFIVDDRTVRVITSKEKYRFMGFSDEQFEKVKHLPSSHLHLTAGNSMVVGVMKSIIKMLTP